jgi:hypothetical protein
MREFNKKFILWAVAGLILLISLSCQEPKETVRMGYQGEYTNRLSIENAEYGFELGIEMAGRLRLRKDRYEMWISTDLFYPNIKDNVTLDESKLKVTLNGTSLIYLGKKGGWNINPVEATKRFSNVYEFVTPEMTEMQMDSLLTIRHEFTLDLGCFVNVNQKCVPFDSVIAFDPTILP